MLAFYTNFRKGLVAQHLENLTGEMEGLADEQVILHGTGLRRTLEQFFKQFLAVYGPLGLSEDERQHIPNDMLGALTGLTIRLLTRPQPPEPAGPPWTDLFERLREARQGDGWLQSVKDSLEPLSRLTNVFPHHIVREGRELGPADRWRALAELTHCTRQVLELFHQAQLYPFCLRFIGLSPDPLYRYRFEFESDPPLGGRECVAFSRFPPPLSSAAGGLFEVLYRQVLLMVPFNAPPRIDPFLVPSWPT
jgi:hypothetical protein